MGLLSKLADTLGLRRPLKVVAPGPLSLTISARQRLAHLPDGVVLQVRTAPGEHGRRVIAEERPSDEPTHPALPGVLISDEDLAHLRGLELDAVDERWRVKVELEVRARETPNPNSRLYLANRILAHDTLSFGSPEGAPRLVREMFPTDKVHHLLFREHTVTVERVPDVPWKGLDRMVSAAIESHLLGCGRPLERADRPPGLDPLEDAIREVLAEKVLPALHQDGGDLELVGVEDGVVRVHLVGACRSCPASALTVSVGVERTLREAFPGEVDRVEPV